MAALADLRATFAPLRDADAFRDRACIHHIRHRRSTADDLLRPLPGRAGVRTRALTRQIVAVAVAGTLPGIDRRGPGGLRRLACAAAEVGSAEPRTNGHPGRRGASRQPR